MIELQHTIGTWGHSTFGPSTGAAIHRRLVEDVEELATALGNDPSGELSATQAEAADVAILLFRLASVCGFNLMAAVDRKMAVNRKRLWQSNGDGTGQHVESL